MGIADNWLIDALNPAVQDEYDDLMAREDELLNELEPIQSRLREIRDNEDKQ